VIDEPGPWGTGPFTLVEGYSSISPRCAIQRPEPFACSWLIEDEDRSDRVVLEANRDHWNKQRGPRLERVVFRNDLSPEEALDACVSGDGEVDIVTEVSPADAERVRSSEHAELVEYDANRVLVGVVNRYESSGAPLGDKRARQALNLAVDKERLVAEGLGGYANPLCALTPSWCGGYPAEAKPYDQDAERARSLMSDAGWPEGRPLAIAAPAPFEGLARVVATDVESVLGLGTEVIVVPEEGMLAGARALNRGD
jgi:ABC-type transport system substrate-binding protein